LGQPLDERNRECARDAGVAGELRGVEFCPLCYVGNDFCMLFRKEPHGGAGARERSLEPRHRGEEFLVREGRGAALVPEDALQLTQRPQTSSAVSITRRSFERCASTAILLPCTVLENPHCGESASCSSGTYLAASSMRRLRSSFFSSSPSFVVTSPSTTVLPLGRNRSGLKSPERASSYSRKY